MDTICDNAKVIEDAYKSGDIPMYTIKVHALKTSARIVGAGFLSSLAAELEQAGKKNALDLIREKTEGLLADYRAFSDKLFKLDEPKEEAYKEPISDDDLKDAYDVLREMIPQMDYGSVDLILTELEGYSLPAEDQERVKKLRELLNNLQWEEMEQLIG
jgi:HPt (histidine-containing phosphotransfer) domain-containing protein